MTDHTVQDKLKQKLESGEIDQEEYDNLMAKFSDLDLLSAKVGKQKKKYSFSGARTIEGGDITEPVRVSGRMRSTSSLSCPSFSVSGSSQIDGELKVTGISKISGALMVEEDAKFGGIFKLSGKAKIGKSAFFTDDGKISGKMEVTSDVVTDSVLKISGKLTAQSIKSTSKLSISGKIQTQGDLEANEFITSGGGSIVGGSIKANLVEIAKKYRLRHSEINDDISEEYGDINETGELGEFISNMVTKFIPNLVNNVVGNVMGGNKAPSTFNVAESIMGKTIDVSYTHVKGDIEGDDIRIGPEVMVDGVIKYRNSIEVPEGHDFKTKKI